MSRAPRRIGLACLLALAATTAGGGQALADGDPASDFLPSLDAYVPIAPAPSPSTAAELNALLRAARASGHPFKVAIIATPADLGAVTSLFGRPQAYVKFLSAEIASFIRGQDATLVVVMPAGVGLIGRDATPAGVVAVHAVRLTGASPTALTQTAVAAVRAVALANHRRLPRVTGSVTSSGSGTAGDATLWIVAAAALAFLPAGVLLASGLRERRAAGGDT